MFIRVLFPAPFSPSRAWISPDSSSKSTWSFATTPGNALTIPLAATAGVADAWGAAVIGPPLARRRGRGRRARGPDLCLLRGYGVSFGSSLVMPSAHQYIQTLHALPGAPGGNWS